MWNPGLRLIRGITAYGLISEDRWSFKLVNSVKFDLCLTLATELIFLSLFKPKNHNLSPWFQSTLSSPNTPDDGIGDKVFYFIFSNRWQKALMRSKTYRSRIWANRMIVDVINKSIDTRFTTFTYTQIKWFRANFLLRYIEWTIEYEIMRRLWKS